MESMESDLSHLSLDTITELHPLRVTFNGGITRLYLHDETSDLLYFLRLGHTRLSMYGTYRTIRVTGQDLLSQGTLAKLANVLSIQKL